MSDLDPGLEARQDYKTRANHIKSGRSCRLCASGPRRLIRPGMSSSTLRLRFLVIGGGLAGVSAAIALTRKGHVVTVLEAEKAFSEVSGGTPTLPRRASASSALSNLTPSARIRDPDAAEFDQDSTGVDYPRRALCSSDFTA
jgi:hypothetical protein